MANSDYAVKTTLYRRNDSITDTAFLSKGDLRDIDIYRYDCPNVVPDSDILTETLWSQEPLSFDNGFDYINIYRAYIYESDENNETSSVKSTDWYLTSSEAYGHMQELCPGIEKQNIFLVFGSVHRPLNQPLVLPCRGILEDGKKGHVLRLETNPMENGTKSKGKFFFPDRKCGAIIPGPIEITSINEKATYGFFIGHNIQFQWPDEAKLADYLLDCKSKYEASGPWTFNTQQKLRFYDSPHFGKFIEFDDRFLVAGKDGSVEIDRSLYAIKSEAAYGKCTEEITVADFLCQGFQNCTENEFREQFKTLAHETRVPLYAMGAENSIKFISDAFDDAVHAKAIGLKKSNNIIFAELYDPLWVAVNLTPDEAESVIASFNRINREAETMVLAKRKKGKL